MLNNLKIPATLFTLLLVIPLGLRLFLGHPLFPFESSYAPQTGLFTYFSFALWPIIFGLLSFALLYFKLRKTKEAFFVLTIFAITPATITAFTTSTPAALFTPLVLLAYLVPPLFSWIFLVLALLTDPLAGLLICILFAGNFFSKGERIPGLLALAPLALMPLFMVTLPEPSALFGEFGSVMGYSLFIVLLGLVSVVHNWKKLDAAKVLLWLVIFFASAYIESLRPLVTIPLALYAGRELRLLLKQEWELDFLKNASFILLLCLGVFVVLTHISLLVFASPSAALVDLIAETNMESRSGALVVPEDVHYIAAHFSDRDVLAATPALLQSVRLREVGPFIAENEVRFVLLHAASDGEFASLVRNNNKFIFVGTEGKYELWLVLQEFVPS